MLTPDKRDHYRLEDHVRVRYRHVSRSRLADDPGEFFKRSESFPVMKQLYRLDLEAREMLRAMDAKNRELGNFLGNLNERLELIMQAMQANEGEPASFDSPVRISQGGISFVADELVSTGTHLALQLNFRDSLLAIAAFAEVRHCRLADDSERYVLGTRFVSLPPGDQELIQRYIVHRQAEERRKQLRR